MLNDLPVSNFGVAVSRPETVAIGRPQVSIVNDSYGKFELSDIGPGQWVVTLSGPSFSKHYVDVTVRAAMVSDLGSVQVRPAVKLTGQAYAGNTPLPYADVHVFPRRSIVPPVPAREGVAVSRMYEKAATVTDADGFFKIDSLPSRGGLGLRVVSEGRSSDVMAVPVSGGDMRVQTHTVGHLTGQVGGSVLPSLIEIKSPSTSSVELVRTDASGEFEIKHLRPGTYEVRSVTLRDRFVVQPKIANVVSNRTTFISLVVEDGLTVTLRRATVCESRAITIDGEGDLYVPCGDTPVRMRSGSHEFCVAGRCRRIIIRSRDVVKLE